MIISEADTWLPQRSWLCISPGLPVAAAPAVCGTGPWHKAFSTLCPCRLGNGDLAGASEGLRSERAVEQMADQLASA